MKTLIISALTAVVLSAGMGSAPALAGGGGHDKCDVGHYGWTVFKTCFSKVNTSKDLPDIFSVSPIYSTGPSSTAYGECGNGYWSSPMPGICNIAISEDMNHGRDADVTDGGTAPTCTLVKTTSVLNWWTWNWNQVGSKDLYTKDGACKVKHHPY